MMKQLLNKTIAIALCVTASAATAQKLPTKQTVSLQAVDTKIDGKTNEKFQAYNTSIEAFYTISNDDENLYLTVKAVQHDIASKIIRGGLSLIINHTIKKNDPEQVTITYPILRNAEMAAVANMYARKPFDQGDGSTTSVKQLNDMLQAKSKTIGLSGIKAIPDKEISVYNEDGIKAVSLFDDKNAYTYELAIPLKYLNLPNAGADAFSYHIKVNEVYMGAQTGGGPPAPPVPISALGTTDFWGEYTLAKK